MLDLRTGEHFRDATKTMTRRETIKGGLGLAAILAAGKAPAMLLGARGVAFGGGKQPIIKDLNIAVYLTLTAVTTSSLLDLTIDGVSLNYGVATSFYPLYSGWDELDHYVDVNGSKYKIGCHLFGFFFKMKLNAGETLYLSPWRWDDTGMVWIDNHNMYENAITFVEKQSTSYTSSSDGYKNMRIFCGDTYGGAGDLTSLRWKIDNGEYSMFNVDNTIK